MTGPTVKRPVDRFEELERELAVVFATAAPNTWKVNRRALFRMCRAARREMRARERRALIGESS